MKVKLYLWEGKWGPFKINTKCQECDVNLAIFKSLQQKFSDQIELVVCPWLDHWFKVLFRHGGWHAPVVLIDDELHSQGVVVDPKEIEEKLLKITSL